MQLPICHCVQCMVQGAIASVEFLPASGTGRRRVGEIFDCDGGKGRWSCSLEGIAYIRRRPQKEGGGDVVAAEGYWRGRRSGVHIPSSTRSVAWPMPSGESRRAPIQAFGTALRTKSSSLEKLPSISAPLCEWTLTCLGSPPSSLQCAPPPSKL